MRCHLQALLGLLVRSASATLRSSNNQAGFGVGPVVTQSQRCPGLAEFHSDPVPCRRADVDVVGTVGGRDVVLASGVDRQSPDGSVHGNQQFGLLTAVVERMYGWNILIAHLATIHVFTVNS